MGIEMPSPRQPCQYGNSERQRVNKSTVFDIFTDVRGVDPGAGGRAPNILLKGSCINRAPPIIQLQYVLHLRNPISKGRRRGGEGKRRRKGGSKKESPPNLHHRSTPLTDVVSYTNWSLLLF